MSVCQPVCPCVCLCVCVSGSLYVSLLVILIARHLSVCFQLALPAITTRKLIFHSSLAVSLFMRIDSEHCVDAWNGKLSRRAPTLHVTQDLTARNTFLQAHFQETPAATLRGRIDRLSLLVTTFSATCPNTVLSSARYYCFPSCLVLLCLRTYGEYGGRQQSPANHGDNTHDADEKRCDK